MQQTINNGDSGLTVRTALNDMFTEIYNSIIVPLKILGIGANTTTLIPANTFITNLYISKVSGTPTIRIGTTANGTDILNDTVPSNLETLSLQQYFGINTTLYITLSSGSVNIRADALYNFF